MRYGRYRGNCILWAGFSLTVCAGISLLIREIISRHLPFSVVGTSLFFLFLFCLFTDAHALRYRRKAEEETGRIRLGECFFTILMMAAAFALRLWVVCRPEETGWFVTEGLREAEPVSVLRIVLQSGGILLLYPALRRISGKIVATVAAAGCSFLPYYVRSCLMSETGSLYFFFFALFLQFAALLLARASKTGKGGWAGLLSFGLFIGASIRVDIIFTAALLALLSGLLVLDAPGERIRSACICLEAAVCGFALTALVQWYGGVDAVMFQGSWRLFFDQGHMIADSSVLYGLMFLLGLAALYIPGFFVQDQNVGLPWILPFLFLTGCSCFMEMRDDGQVTLLIWLIVSGVGIHSMFCPRPEAEEEREGEEAAMPSSGNLSQLREMPERKPAPLRPGEPIPNPLPVPGKHVHKELDYAFHPPEEKMCYDLNDLDENDDFEI